MKITQDVQGGDYNPFVGDNGNYEDRHDVIVGNHHAREWMSYEVPMMQLEVIAFSYENIGYDNDGDGLVDEDTWGDSNGDGQLDDDGDCLALAAEYQDSNGDGTNCGPGDLGVDEDYSEQFITDLVNSREIYLIPMLNVDGNIYDREVFCPAPAWESCPSGGWRKNLRDNTFTGVTPLPDLNEQVDEDCDGVDLNRNYQFEWARPSVQPAPSFRAPVRRRRMNEQESPTTTSTTARWTTATTTATGKSMKTTSTARTTMPTVSPTKTGGAETPSPRPSSFRT